MFTNYRAQGLILRKEDRGDADQLFTIYTKEFGRLEIFGKAIRKISSKLRPGADIFYLSDIEFIQGKTHKTLTDAVLTDKFKNLRNDLGKLKIAYRISEIIDNFIRGQEADENVWELLIEVFRRLNGLQFSGINSQILYYYFLFNALSLLGYRSELYNCSICAKKIVPEEIYFSVKEGGTICQDCSFGARNAKRIKPETVKIMRIFLKKNLKTLPKIKIGQEYLKELELFAKTYIAQILNTIT